MVYARSPIVAVPLERFKQSGVPMDDTNEVERATERAPRRLALRIALGVVSMVVFVAVFFLIAGRIDWLAGWAYLGLTVCGQGVSVLYLWRKDPELLRRRAEMGEGTKTWDKACLGLFGTACMAIVLVAALDAGRFGWSAMPVWLWPVGAVLYAFFFVLITWAMAANTFFEKTVRIQHDRGHRVIDSGPYRFVRHPGYLAVLVGFLLPPPLLLGSWWAMIPAFVGAALLIVRTVLEDRTLRRELPGYKDYAQRVRYRLVPGVW